MSTEDTRTHEAQSTAVAPLGRWLLGFSVLCLFAVVGDVLSSSLHLPVPGSILGMLLLLVALLLRVPHLEAVVRPGASTLLAVVPLLLVPLAVGVIDDSGAVAPHLLAYAVAIVVAWVLCALTAAGVYGGVHRITRGRR